MQSRRKIIPKGAFTVKYLVDQHVLDLDDEGVGMCDPTMVQAERKFILGDVFIDQGKKIKIGILAILIQRCQLEKGLAKGTLLLMTWMGV